MLKRDYRKLWWQNNITKIFFSVLPLLFISISIYSHFNNVYTEKVIESIKTTAENRKGAIDLFFDERISQLVTIANTNSFEQLTNETYLNKVFNIMQTNSKSYMDIGIIDNEGKHVAYVGPYYSILKAVNYKNEPWFNAVMNNGIYVSDIFMGFRKLPHFIIAVLVREDNRSWILRVTINLETIDEIVQKAWIGSSGDAFIINKNNSLQTKPRLGGNYLETPNCPDYSSTSIARTEKFSYEGKERFYCAIQIKTNKWILVLSEDPNELLSPILHEKYWTAFLTFIGLLFIISGSVITTNILIKRLIDTDKQNAMTSDMVLQSNKMIALSKMAAGIAHEINNPLAVIGEKAGWIKDLIMEEDIAKSENFQEFSEAVDKIELHVERARKVTHRLLGFARRMEPAREKVDVNRMLDETTGFLENEAKFMNIEIIKNFSDDVPVITSDLSQLQQVVLNLLNNAFDAIDHEGSITVSTDFDEQACEALISIADTGPGIPKAIMNKIFDPFFTTKEVGKGTGLGLSISYSIIEKLGGKIKVNSNEGIGTVFTIVLPANQG
ncbi:sensor histidine kinase [Desulforegula conservatrix]|uniref:sensor histidine kinase n=1 Tax=Desulforegula conservatrix TaxID=153026 RepID=UPI0003F63050|nr:PAS domain-containing sensor histidine kinase [Desulforegula conservatrix]